jgi:integrase
MTRSSRWPRKVAHLLQLKFVLQLTNTLRNAPLGSERRSERMKNEGVVVEPETRTISKRERGSGRIWKRGAFYWIQYYDQHGRQVRESSHSPTEQVAKRLLRRRLAEKEAGLLPDRAAHRITIEELADAFLQDYKNNAKNIAWAQKCWGHLKGRFAVMRAVHLKTDDISAYIDGRKAGQASNATINRELACLRRMFRLGTQCTPPKVQRVPIFPPRLKEARPRSGFVEDAQYKRLCDNCKKPWLRAFLAIAYTFGFRSGELLKLRVRQVDLLERTIRLEPGTTKNKAGRTVKMTEEVSVHLVECVRGKQPDDLVFTWPDGRPVRDFRVSWTNLTKAAGLPGTLVHDLRRSAVRKMIRRGIPEVVAMKISGHKTRSVFDRYNIVSDADIEEAARRLEPERAPEVSRDKTGTETIQQARPVC